MDLKQKCMFLQLIKERFSAQVPVEVFHGFPQFFWANVGTVHQIRLCLLRSKFFPIHYSPVIQHYIVLATENVVKQTKNK